MHLIFVTLIPFTVLFCLNKTIHRKLSERDDSVRRTGDETLRRRELRLARVSLCIVLLYMVCHSPKLVPTVCEILFEDAKVGRVWATSKMYIWHSTPCRHPSVFQQSQTLIWSSWEWHQKVQWYLEKCKGLHFSDWLSHIMTRKDIQTSPREPGHFECHTLGLRSNIRF